MTKIIPRSTPEKVGILKTVGTVGQAPFSIKTVNNVPAKTPRPKVKNVPPNRTPNNTPNSAASSQKSDVASSIAISETSSIKSMEELLEEAEKIANLGNLELLETKSKPEKSKIQDPKSYRAKQIVPPVPPEKQRYKIRPVKKYTSTSSDSSCDSTVAYEDLDVFNMPFFQG